MKTNVPSPGVAPLSQLETVKFTRSLMDIESTTYNEGAVGRYLDEFLRGRGFDVEMMAVEQPKGSVSTAERFNIYAGTKGETPDLVFSTHMDTVPPFIPSSEDEEFIHGRGACDAKGIIAAQVAAAERLRAEGLKIGLLFVSGEERDSAGAKVANQHARKSRFLINGEPTENRIAIASKGALRVDVKAKGKMAHSAYPHLGESATVKLVKALDRLLEIELPVTEDVGPSTLNIGTIEGGRAPNVIADHASAQVLIRLVGPSDEIRKSVDEACAGLAETDYVLDIPFQRLRTLEGLPAEPVAFTTDVPWLSNWGEPVLLGPGTIHVAHTPYEKLAKKELFEAIDLYVEVAQRLLNEPV
ncbi:M20/M25/M40 family metallo-hydrolase [Silvibacterium acidisoli]|uniref:M20/M25/M40 family metallo-hydrolase n=1 Tax=Acidobacteriaceae bacterium ZG23-2 TaxID=2883246 RepID=UPI00406C3218